MFDDEYIKSPQPQHPGKYDCGCVMCQLWRRGQLKPGDLVTPIRLDPEKYRTQVNAICIWGPDEHVIWNRRWPAGTLGVFIRFVPKGHKANYVHGCIVKIFDKNCYPGPEKCCSASDLVKLK